MKRPSRRLLALLLLAGVAAAFPLYRALTRPPVRYTVRGVAIDEGNSSRATGLNNRGEILGDIDEGNPTHRVFVERDGRRNTFRVPGKGILPHSIIESGDFLCQRNGPRNLQLVLYRDGHLIEPMAHGVPLTNGRLTPDGTVAGTIDINTSKASPSASFEPRAVLWRDGRVTDLSVKAVSAEEDAMAWAMDTPGLVVGTAGLVPVLWRSGKAQRLPLLPGFSDGIPSAMNEREQIAGICYKTHPDIVFRACLWENGTVRSLGTLSGHSFAADINSEGRAVGNSVLRGNPQVDWRAWRTPKRMLSFDRIKRATLFEDGKALDLNDLIPRRSGWTLEIAADINDKGQIVGTGRYKGQKRGFVLTPVEPG